MKTNKMSGKMARFLSALYSNAFYRWLNSPVNSSLETIPFLTSLSPSKGYYIISANCFSVALTVKFPVGNCCTSVTSSVIRALSSQVPVLLQLKMCNMIRPGARETEPLLSHSPCFLQGGRGDD
jgi:hypothetical protein